MLLTVVHKVRNILSGSENHILGAKKNRYIERNCVDTKTKAKMDATEIKCFFLCGQLMP